MLLTVRLSAVAAGNVFPAGFAQERPASNSLLVLGGVQSIPRGNQAAAFVCRRSSHQAGTGGTSSPMTVICTTRVAKSDPAQAHQQHNDAYHVQRAVAIGIVDWACSCAHRASWSAAAKLKRSIARDAA